MIANTAQTKSLAAKMLLLATLVIPGCSGNGEGRVIVSGIVTYDTVPVADGLIRFVPTGATKGNVTVTRILGGVYKADAMGGVPVGTHRVEIQSFDPNDERPGLGPARTQFLPEKYNRQSELTAELTDESGKTTIDFNLPP